MMQMLLLFAVLFLVSSLPMHLVSFDVQHLGAMEWPLFGGMYSFFIRGIGPFAK